MKERLQAWSCLALLAAALILGGLADKWLL